MLKSLTELSEIPFYLKVLLFLNLFFSFFFFRDPFDFYIGYIAFIFLLPVFVFRFGIPKHLGIVFTVLVFAGVSHSLIGNNSLGSFFKVFVGLSASYLFFYYVVFQVGLRLHTLFKFYLAGGLFCALVGIGQVLSFFVGFRPGYDFSWILDTWGVVPGGLFGIRVSTFFGEPTYHAMFLSGAVFVALHDLLYRKKQYFFNGLSASLMIIGVYVSFSGTIIGSLVLSVVLIGLNYGFIRYAIFGFPVAAIILIQLVQSSDEFRRRYEGTVNIFIDSPTEAFNVFKYHGSSVILYNNFYIAKENFKRNFLFGTGLGSHPVAVEKYSLTKDVKTKGFTLNTKDANSMFNRLMSETGLFGLLLFSFILVKFFVSRKREEPEDDYLWLISSACLVVIFVNLLRQGHYFLNGFPFYIWMYTRSYLEREKSAMLAGRPRTD